MPVYVATHTGTQPSDIDEVYIQPTHEPYSGVYGFLIFGSRGDAVQNCIDVTGYDEDEIGYYEIENSFAWETLQANGGHVAFYSGPILASQVRFFPPLKEVVSKIRVELGIRFDQYEKLADLADGFSMELTDIFNFCLAAGLQLLEAPGDAGIVIPVYDGVITCNVDEAAYY